MNFDKYIKATLAGNKDSFIPIIEYYEAKLYQAIRTLGMNDVQAEKTIVHSFQQVYHSLLEYTGAEPFTDWFLSKVFPPIIHQHQEMVTKQDEGKQESISDCLSSLPKTTQYALVLENIFNTTIVQIANLLNISIEEVEEIIFDGKWRMANFSQKDKLENCLPLKTLFAYQHKKLTDAQIIEVVDHLEFCPSCRDQLGKFQRRAEELGRFFQSPTLSMSFQGEILKKIKPFRKKQRKHSLRYQFIAVVLTVAMFSTVIYFMPSFDRWATLATNYVKYGDFYNVWAEGTYQAMDNDITVEFTALELTPLLLRIDYKIVTERELKDDNNHFIWKGVFHIKTGEELKPIPIETTTSFATNEDKKEGSFFLNLNDIEDLHLPERFILHFETMRVAGVFGNWQMELPVENRPGNMETIPIQQTFTFNNIIDLKLDTFVTSGTGSQLNFSLDFTEIEQKRLLDNLDELKGRGIGQYLDFPHLTYIYSVVNELGEELMPHPWRLNHIIMYGDHWETIREKKQLFHPYLYDPTELPYSVKKKKEKDEPLYFQLDQMRYSENVLLDVPIPLKEVKNAPLNVQYNGTVFESYSIERLEADDEKPERYGLTIYGNHGDSNHVKRFSWSWEESWYNETVESRISAFWEDSMHHYLDSPFENITNELFTLEVPVDQELPEFLPLRIYYVENYYRFDDNTFRVPLFGSE